MKLRSPNHLLCKQQKLLKKQGFTICELQLVDDILKVVSYEIRLANCLVYVNFGNRFWSEEK